MGRAPCCDKANVKKGPWSPEEDRKLKEYIQKNGTGGNWIAFPHKAGLKRCGKSCRLRWLNYLRPNIKHGDFSDDEDRIICNLFATIGSRWSIIAAQLPGRTDNDIKNYWNTKLKKKLMHGLQAPYTTHNHHSTTVSSAAAAVASPQAVPIMSSLQHLSSTPDYSHLYSSGGSGNSTTSFLSAATSSRGRLLINGGEQQALRTSPCLDSGGGHGIYFHEPCATTVSGVVHGLGTETFVFGGFQLQEDHHHKAEALLLAGSGAANQLDEQYNFAASCCYGEEKAPPLISLTGGADGAGGGTSSSFFYDGTYSEETATTTRAGAQ